MSEPKRYDCYIDRGPSRSPRFVGLIEGVTADEVLSRGGGIPDPGTTWSKWLEPGAGRLEVRPAGDGLRHIRSAELLAITERLDAATGRSFLDLPPALYDGAIAALRVALDKIDAALGEVDN